MEILHPALATVRPPLETARPPMETARPHDKGNNVLYRFLLENIMEFSFWLFSKHYCDSVDLKELNNRILFVGGGWAHIFRLYCSRQRLPLDVQQR